jgi:hypothetical protein
MLLNRLKKIVLAFSILLIFTLVGCADLGDFENIQDYYNSFGEITLSVTNDNEPTFSVEDFYNEESQEDFTTIVEMNEYVYFSVEVSKTMEVDTFSMFFLGQTNETLSMSIFVVDSIPTNFREYDEPLEDGEGNQIEYDDPEESEIIANVSLSVKTEEWNSFSADEFLIDGVNKSTINIESGKFILIRFNNNSYIGKENSLNKVSFKMTNMMIRSLKKEA